MKIEFHPGAEADANAAWQWYAERSPVAARAFSTELIASVERIAQSPEAWPPYLAGTRRYFFPKFPFSLVYRVAGDTLTVMAVAHHRRKPGYWGNRH